MPARKLPFSEIALLALVLVAGLALRVRDIELYRMSPDEGNYLHSARVQQLERSPDVGEALAADLEWLPPRYYPHSYLHQLCMRWVWRSGGDAVFSVRIDSALLGLLTALAVYVFVARAWPERRPAALVAASIVALQCLHVWYSRTGWGQTGCTFFFAVYLALGWFLFAKERTRRADFLLAAGMGIASLLAYGWHEMIVVHVGGMGIFVLLHHLWGGAGFEGSGWRRLGSTLFRSRKAWAALASALPIVALFAALFADPFARKHWIDFDPEGRPPYFEFKGLILRFLFGLTHIERQIGWPVLLLAFAGLASFFRRDRFAFRFFTMALVTSTLTFFLFYKDANLVRIYLPAAVVLAILAGEGLVAVCAAAGAARRVAVAHGAAVVLALWMGAVSWQTIWGWEDDPLFVRVFHREEGYELRDARDAQAESFAILRRELEPGEWVGVQARSSDGKNVHGEFSILYRLLDAGFDARPFAFLPREGRPPRFLMGVEREMAQQERTVETGGRYRRVSADTFGRVGLYRLDSTASD